MASDVTMIKSKTRPTFSSALDTAKWSCEICQAKSLCVSVSLAVLLKSELSFSLFLDSHLQFRKS